MKPNVKWTPARRAAGKLLTELRSIYAGASPAEEVVLEHQINRAADIYNETKRLEVIIIPAGDQAKP